MVDLQSRHTHPGSSPHESGVEREEEKDSCQIMAWNGVMSEVQQRENTAFLTSRVSEGYSWMAGLSA